MVGLRMFYHNHHLFQKTSFQSKLSQKPRRRSCVYPWLGGAMPARSKSPTFDQSLQSQRVER
ncbi:hypothetical protein HanRHA438_Chr07g0298041 [Helianthus annuus]|uniref:Uncharacterized protein n=1 Tax=Helianthus annuus TaxID=4232 RepID=A0A251UKH4_HELAN|nr:hypothetical protein HanXRQr2_Chr07g0287371 [Helianthus annuus]KAJ0549657.1 hypothetical protein HanHA300_Chr07g0236331 [Helianthus annuus]KAJ0562612.1 hypothetical protein HanHA89_Chr07g0253511 [Helianthus annuus]KAJ0727987.1 hypothetical protein HanLR1_Chr07g0236271 [Helianthus annuus]KAJ0730769.1 hypothetical protein HanOQP8_Chr07g0244061 [Helianthus annuus]